MLCRHRDGSGYNYPFLDQPKAKHCKKVILKNKKVTCFPKKCADVKYISIRCVAMDRMDLVDRDLFSFLD